MGWILVVMQYWKYLMMGKHQLHTWVRIQVMMMIGENSGRFDSLNKIGESVNSLEIGSGGSFRCESQI